jgi:hypothetical protein
MLCLAAARRAAERVRAPACVVVPEVSPALHAIRLAAMFRSGQG